MSLRLVDRFLHPDQAAILRQGLRRSYIYVAAFLLVTVATSIATVAGPLIFVHAVSNIDRPVVQLFGFFVVFAASAALARFFGDVKTVLTNRVQQDVGHIASDDLLVRVMNADNALFDHINASKISAVVQSFNQSNKIYIQMFMMVIVGSIADVAVAVAVVVDRIDPLVAVFVIIYGAATIALTLRSNKVTEHYLRRAQKKTNDNANLLGNVIGDLVSIRIYRGQGWIAGINRTNYLAARDSWNSFYTRRIGYSATQGLLVLIQYCGAFATLLWLHGNGAGLSEILLLVLILAQLNRPFELVGTSLRDFAVARSMAMPALEILTPAASAATPAQPTQRAPRRLSRAPIISVNNLSVRYPGSTQPALDSFSAQFTPGGINFVVGPSGSGKTTLMRALLRLATTYHGSITIDGVDLATMSDEQLWAEVGYVPQEPVLMNLPVRDNILMGRAASDDRILEVLATVGLRDKIERLSAGLDEHAGEGGRLFSGGEKQRLSIARALLDKPRIIFLDEASSALDGATEHSILAALRATARTATIIAITHRTDAIDPICDTTTTIAPIPLATDTATRA